MVAILPEKVVSESITISAAGLDRLAVNISEANRTSLPCTLSTLHSIRSQLFKVSLGRLKKNTDQNQ